MNCQSNPRYCRCKEHRAEQQRGYYEYKAKREGRKLNPRGVRGPLPKLDPDRAMTATMEWSEANGGPHGYHSTLDADYLVFLQAVMSST